MPFIYPYGVPVSRAVSWNSRSHRHGAAEAAIDPVCGMTVDPAESPHRHDYRHHAYHFCSAGCRAKFAADPEKYLANAQHRRARARAARGHDLYLPDASGNPASRARRLSDLRHGARAGSRRRRRRRRTCRHDAPVLDFACADFAGRRARDGRPSRPPASRRQPFDMAAIRCWRRRWCCGAAGRFSSAARNRCVSRHLNMFTLIAMGTGVAYGYSVVAALAPGLFPAAFRDRARRHRALFRGRLRHHRAGPARPGAGIARPRVDVGRDPRPPRARAEKRAARQRRRQRRGRRRSTPSSRRPAARAAGRKNSGRRRAGRGQIRGRRIDDHRRSHAGDEGAGANADRRHAQPERRLRHARGKSRPRHHARAYRRHGRRPRSARARRSSGSPIRSPAGSCPR